MYFVSNFKISFFVSEWVRPQSSFETIEAHYLYALSGLTHLPLGKIAVISLMVFSDAFLWRKSFVFWSWFHWNLFLTVQLTISLHWFRQWLGAEYAARHYLNQCWSDSLTRICGIRAIWIWYNMTRSIPVAAARCVLVFLLPGLSGGHWCDHSHHLVYFTDTEATVLLS